MPSSPTSPLPYSNAHSIPNSSNRSDSRLQIRSKLTSSNCHCLHIKQIRQSSETKCHRWICINSRESSGAGLKGCRACSNKNISEERSYLVTAKKRYLCDCMSYSSYTFSSREIQLLSQPSFAFASRMSYQLSAETSSLGISQICYS